MLTVNELAKRSGVSAHTVRFYIRSGLLTPVKTQANKYRLFATEDVSRLKFIRTAKALGFTINDVQQIFGHVVAGESPCAEVRVLIRERMLEVEEKIRDMQELQQRMTTALQRWEDMPDKGSDGSGICPLIEAMTDV